MFYSDEPILVIQHDLICKPWHATIQCPCKLSHDVTWQIVVIFFFFFKDALATFLWKHTDYHLPTSRSLCKRNPPSLSCPTKAESYWKKEKKKQTNQQILLNPPKQHIKHRIRMCAVSWLCTGANGEVQNIHKAWRNGQKEARKQTADTRGGWWAKAVYL